MTTTENTTPSSGGEIKILIATPCYSGQCYTGYTISLMKTYAYFRQFRNIRLLHRFINYDACIARARNNFVGYTLADPSITHLFFVDDDMRWEPEDLVRLLKHNKPIVGGALPKKKYIWERLRTPRMREIIMDDNLSKEEFKKKIKAGIVDYAAGVTANTSMIGGLVEAKKIGTGFLLIQRFALEKLCEAYPERRILTTVPEIPLKVKDHVYSFFDQETKNGEYLSEGYCFCRLWEAIGGKVYADLTINLDHHGSEDYEGNFLAVYGPKKHN